MTWMVDASLHHGLASLLEDIPTFQELVKSQHVRRSVWSPPLPTAQ